MNTRPILENKNTEKIADYKKRTIKTQKTLNKGQYTMKHQSVS